MAQAAGGVMVCKYFLGTLWAPIIEHCLNATAYSSIIADHNIHPFLTTVCPSSDGYFQQDNTP